METTRQSKISRLIQKDLSDIFQNETRKTHGTLISVSIVRVSPDLSVAKAYLSIFPPENHKKFLNRYKTMHDRYVMNSHNGFDSNYVRHPN